MKLMRFIKTLFLHVRLNLLMIPKGSWIVVRSNDVTKATRMAKEIDRMPISISGVIVVGPEISVDTIRTVPQETRRALLAALMRAEEE